MTAFLTIPIESARRMYEKHVVYGDQRPPAYGLKYYPNKETVQESNRQSELVRLHSEPTTPPARPDKAIKWHEEYGLAKPYPTLPKATLDDLPRE